MIPFDELDYQARLETVHAAIRTQRPISWRLADWLLEQIPPRAMPSVAVEDERVAVDGKRAGTRVPDGPPNPEKP